MANDNKNNIPTTSSAPNQVVSNADIKKVGDQVAQDMGAENAKEFVAQTNSKINSRNSKMVLEGRQAATDFTSKLLKLTLYQEIQASYELSKYKWIEFFNDEKIEAGDSKQYIKDLLTGVDTYDINNFVPAKATLPAVDSTLIRLYNDDGTINKYGFTAQKPLTIFAENWFPYFISGKLMQFINTQVDLMSKSMFLYKYKALTGVITDMLKTDASTVKISKRVTGTAPNILSAFVNEIFPLVEDMQYFNNEYNLDETKNTQYMNINNREDLIMLMNRKTYFRFKNGVLANTLKNNLVSWNDVLPQENIIGTGKNINVGTSDNNITVLDTELIPENTVVVLNKNVLKYLWFVEVQDSQKFVQNMSIQYVNNLWGVFGAIPWEGALIYTNDNLLTLPLQN